MFFFFKQKTAYEMRISDWSSDVCSSDLSINWDRKSITSCGRICASSMISTGLPAPLLANSASQSWAEIELPAPCHPNPAATPAASSASKKDGMSEMPARAASHNTGRQIGRAHVCTPVTNAHLVCRLLLEKKINTTA